MRHLIAAVALTLAPAPAFAGAEAFFMGRPPSVGVVQGGAFGAGGFDYLDEAPRRPAAAPRPPRTVRRLAHVGGQVGGRVVGHAGRVGQGAAPRIVARPYYRP